MSQTRSFCYVDDLIEGFLRLMDSDRELNRGNRGEFTVPELAKAMTGSSSDIVYMELPQDDRRRRKPDISLAQRVLNWEPTVQLDVGLRKAIRYFSQLVAAPASHQDAKPPHDEGYVPPPAVA